MTVYEDILTELSIFVDIEFNNVDASRPVGVVYSTGLDLHSFGPRSPSRDGSLNPSYQICSSKSLGELSINYGVFSSSIK